MNDKKQSKILTYKQYCEEYINWSKETFKKKVEDEGFPAEKDSTGWVMSRREVDLWWAKKGLKVG